MMDTQNITDGDTYFHLSEEQGRTLWTAVTVLKWAAIGMFVGVAIFIGTLYGFHATVDTQAGTINNLTNTVNGLEDDVASAKAETLKNRELGYKNAARHCANTKALGVPIEPGTEPGDCYSIEVLKHWDPNSIPVAATKEQLQSVADRNFYLACANATPEVREKAKCPPL